MTRRQKLFWALVIAYSIFHVGYSVVRYSVFSGLSSGDFNRVYQEATNWERSGTYTALEGNWHPPFYYWVLLNLDHALGGQKPLIYFLYFSQFLLYVLAIRWMARAARVERQSLGVLYLLAAVLVVNFQPFLETLAQHKVEGWEFCLIALALLCYRRKQDLLCGAAVMLAVNLKYLPGILLLYFLVKREYKVLLGAALMEIVALAIVAHSYGMGTVWYSVVRNPIDQLLVHRQEGTFPQASVEMQTLAGTINRLMAHPNATTPFIHYIEVGSYMPIPRPELAARIASVLRLLLMGSWIFFIRRPVPVAERERRWPRIRLELALTLVMILILSQAARVHYGILLLPAFVLAGLAMAQEPGRFTRMEKGLFIASYVLSAMLVPGGLLNRLPPMPVWGSHYSNMYLWYSLPFCGYLLLGACLLLCARRLKTGREGGIL